MNKRDATDAKPAAPAKEAPLRSRGHSGRGAASALEVVQRLEKVRPKQERPPLWD